MAKKASKEFWNTAKVNNKTFDMHYNRLTELAINVFEWKNVPDTIDPRFLELALFSDGMAVFFRDEVMGFLALQCMISGSLDVYRIPIMRRAYATNGYNKQLSNEDSVIIFNNYLHTNCLNDIELYALRLYEIDRAIDVNIKGQKTPKIITCDENQRLPMKNLFMQYDGNEPFIFGDKKLTQDAIKVLDCTTPYVANDLMILRSQIWNNALSYIGIENASSEKRERLVSGESDANTASIRAQRLLRLNSRRDACKKINTMFGLDMSVDYRTDISVDLAQLDAEEGIINKMEGGNE